MAGQAPLATSHWERDGVTGWIARHPVASIVVGLALSFGLAAGGQPPSSNDGEDLAPSAPALRAAARIDQLFPERTTTSAIQVVVDEVDGILSPSGLADMLAIRELATATFGDRLADTGVLTPADPLITSMPGGPTTKGDPAIPTSRDEVLTAWEQATGALPPQVAGRLDALFPVDAAPADATAALVVVLLEEGVDVDALTAAEADFADRLATLDEVEAAAFSPNLVAAQDLAGQILSLLGIAVLVILVLLVVVFFPSGSMSRTRRTRRAVADAFVAVVVALLTVQSATGFSAWLGPDNLGLLGAQTGPSQAIPILLIGLAVDYVIHLNREYRDDLHDGTPPRMSTAIALAGVRRALVLSAITTILGFLTNTLSGIRGLRDFGIVAAFGILMALVLTALLFPSVRQLLDRRAVRRGTDLAAGLEPDRDGRLATAIGHLEGLTRRPWATVVVAAAITALGGLAATNLAVEFSFLDFVPTDSPLRATADRLAEEFDGGGETLRILVEADLTDPAVHNGLVAADAALDDIDTLQRAGDRAQVTSAIRTLAGLLAPNREAGPDPDVAALVADELDRDLRARPDSDLAAVWEAARAAAPELRGLLSLESKAAVTEAVAGDITDAAAFEQELLAAHGDVLDAGATVAATSLALNDEAIVSRLSNIQVQSLVLAILAGLLVLVVAFWRSARQPLIGVLTIVPVALSVIVLFGVMALVGIPFTPVTATLAALAIGIGVDYAIHLSTRFLRERATGTDIAQAVRESLVTTGSALAGSGVTTAAGFAVLTFSTLIPFRQLGQVTLIAIVAAVASTTMLLPSLLVLAARRSGTTT